MGRIITLAELKQFAQTLGKTITTKPIKLKMTIIPPTKTYEVTMRSLWAYRTFPGNPRKKAQLAWYEILINKKYYNESKTDVYELQQGIIHELSHAKTREDNFKKWGVSAFNKPNLHDNTFKKVARELGADRLHQKQYWDDARNKRKGV